MRWTHLSAKTDVRVDHVTTWEETESLNLLFHLVIVIVVVVVAVFCSLFIWYRARHFVVSLLLMLLWF